MSSAAAVQPSTSAVSHRQGYSVAARDQVYLQQSPSSTNTARKSSTRTSNANTPNASVQPQYPSPTVSNGSDMTTPRAAPQPFASHASPTGSPAGSGPSVPPRISSSHRSPPTSAGAPSPKYDPAPSQTPRTAQSSTMADDNSSRRRAQQSPREPTSASRSAEASRPSLPHEESTIINRLVISDPAEDVARDQARAAEARPLPVTGSNGTGYESSTTAVATPTAEDSSSTRHTRQGSRHEGQSGRRKEVKFGEYILGQTLGEGEFGKVKMGWKRDGSTQVAIKLIRRETLGSNPTRLPKIYREIAILRELEHPNIVRLHEMVETERHIGIILEYASGGELFDYILQNRYLKDNAARRLFAQLISGVGYLHKKGIVHRDLKLENLLLDRNRNIIITDFGFANTFNSNDNLTDEIEYNLTNKDFVKRLGLDHTDDEGHRRGDLMQTSCGSPCYAAPELVVTDSLYTGRKVDVWSCGVILYAMLAGYLPFDDDPDNPEGDNINLLYKYIVSTPLIFPEYVTPHARDLLKRILVPDPRKRADLFEIARHSWLSEYAHVVGLITSSTTTTKDISNTTVPSGYNEVPHLARSASVREPTSKAHGARQPPQVGGLAPKTGQVDPNAEAKTPRDAKRRTVQVEYVAPQSPNTRPDPSSAKTRARTGSQGPIEVSGSGADYSRNPAAASMQPPTRPAREQPRAVSENVTSQRPTTGGSLAANRLPSRGSYGQPAVAVAREQAQGRISQPRLASYNGDEMPGRDRRSYMGPDDSEYSQGYPQTVTSAVPGQGHGKASGHRRSNTLSGLSEKLGFSKRGSLFGGKGDDEEKPRKSKKYPPVSMTKPMHNDNNLASGGAPAEPRKSSDSRRTSFSFSRKSSTPKDDQPESKRSSRRFSFIPSFGRKEDKDPNYRPEPRPRIAFGRGESRSPSRSTTNDSIHALYDSTLDRPNNSASNRKPVAPTSQPYPNPYPPSQAFAGDYSYPESPIDRGTPTPPAGRRQEQQHNVAPDMDYGYAQPAAMNSRPSVDYNSSRHGSKPSVLHKRRNFNDGYDQQGDHSGSSGAAKKVMALFTFRRKARVGQQ
ncbi:Pkinase-domain-containing protein [Microthyrium microscopicum]|uniref:non-specific serine/threonine protein kinase n=1 Tax=Microthyrium microscopicum TaxID=703497 RepID=A0A6A6UCN1_9PEZI|nr:Pkinase-domain-containing protein [Microthyrium microscopicum]